MRTLTSAKYRKIGFNKVTRRWEFIEIFNESFDTEPAILSLSQAKFVDKGKNVVYFCYVDGAESVKQRK